jgi:hypothetical protein
MKVNCGLMVLPAMRSIVRRRCVAPPHHEGPRCRLRTSSLGARQFARVSKDEFKELARALNSSEQNQYQQNNNDEPEAAAAVIAGAIEGTAADAAKAAEQGDHQDNQNDCTNGHRYSSSRPLTLIAHVPASQQMGIPKVPASCSAHAVVYVFALEHDVQRFSLATNAKGVCAEIMLNQGAKAR